MLVAPVIRDVAHGPCVSRFNFQESSIRKRCQFMHVKSWHSFFRTRGVFVGVSKLKRDATMSSITNTPQHQRVARIFS